MIPAHRRNGAIANEGTHGNCEGVGGGDDFGGDTGVNKKPFTC